MVRHLIFGAVMVCCPLWARAAAQTFYWYGDVINGNWTASSGGNTNWSLRSDANQNTSNLPDGDDTVVFSVNGVTRRAVTVAGSPTIDNLAFNSSASSSYTLSSSKITLNASGGTGLSVDDASAKHTISTDLILGSDQAFEIQTPAAPGANALLISGKISGSGRKLTKTGGGILDLTNGLNDYSGGTTISDGLLRLTNAANTSTTGGGAVLVDVQGTLGGNGAVGGAVDVKGTIAPGASIGTLHTGGQDWFAGGGYQLEINAITGTPGVNWDLLNINGTLDLSSAAGFGIELLTLDNTGQLAALTGFDNTTAQSWVIAQAQGITNFTPGLLSVDDTLWANDLDGGSFGIGVDGNNLLLQFSPVSNVPEPSGLLLAAGVLLGLSRRRTSRGKSSTSRAIVIRSYGPSLA